MHNSGIKIKSNLNQKSAYLFILPAFILFALIIILPIVYNINLSFFKWNGIAKTKDFIGIENYSKILNDSTVLVSLRNALLFFVITVVISIILGFIIAFLISRISVKYRALSSIFRTIFFLPAVIGPVYVGIVFRQILSGSDGYLNNFLIYLGLEKLAINWIGDTRFAIFFVLLTYVWWIIGYDVVLFIANIQLIPKDYYEAATIDGANTFQQALHITIPQVRPTTYTLMLLGAISALKEFALVYSLTQGGPIYSTQFLTIYIYDKTFKLGQVGYASALANILMVLALIVTLIQLKFYDRQKY